MLLDRFSSWTTTVKYSARCLVSCHLHAPTSERETPSNLIYELSTLHKILSCLDNSRLEHDAGGVHRSVKHAFHGGSLAEHVQRHQQEQTHLPREQNAKIDAGKGWLSPCRDKNQGTANGGWNTKTKRLQCDQLGLCAHLCRKVHCNRCDKTAIFFMPATSNRPIATSNNGFNTSRLASIYTYLTNILANVLFKFSITAGILLKGNQGL